jgi:hypothetical protein
MLETVYLRYYDLIVLTEVPDCCFNPTAPSVGFNVETIVAHILESVQSTYLVDLNG